jgi:hypothetical protein
VSDGWDDDGDDLLVRRRRNPLVAVIAVLVVLALVGGGVLVAFDRTDDTDGDTELAPPMSVTRPPATVDHPPSVSDIDAVVAELSAFVADARGHEFREPVEATLLPDDAFAARIREDAVEDIAELEDDEDVLRAFGLLDADVDLADVLLQFLGGGVVGFYDPETGELVLRGAELTPYVRLTLVHELTHALDDQLFELDRPALDDADDESGFAFSALTEGNALRVEEQYRETLSEDERDEATAEEARLSAGLDLTGIPRVIPELIGFPYAFGPDLVGELLEAGGEARVDAAFAAPPVTSEQVLDPEGWLDGEDEPVTVPAPEADGEVFDEGVLGLWGLVLILEDELGQADAVQVAQGWGGDWYVAWRDGDRTCVRATFVMDSERDLVELADGLEDWTAEHDGASSDRDGDRVTLDSCA